MKKALFAMVCLLAMFASCNKEKPNEKFIGNYHADRMDISGTVNVPIMGEMPIDFPLLDVDLSITAGDKKDEVIGVMKFSQDSEHNEYQMKGVCSEKVIDFEQVSVTLKNIDNTDIVLTLNVSGVGNLNGTTLNYTGTFNGTGTITWQGTQVSGNINDGIINNTAFVKQANSTK